MTYVRSCKRLYILYDLAFIIHMVHLTADFFRNTVQGTIIKIKHTHDMYYGRIFHVEITR